MKRSSARSRLRIVLTAIFAVGFVWSLFMTFSSFAAANLFKIQDAKLSDLSANVSGTISSFDESTIVSNVTFHKLNDSAKYTIALKNTDSKDHIIESISDDNENAHINYLYDSYTNTLVKAGDSFDFVVTAKYTNAVTDMNARAQATNVKFMIKYLDIAEPEAISVNPSTGDEIAKNVIILTISATGLIICIAIALKRNKKLNKIAAIAIAAVAATTIATSVKAATVEVNSFTLTTNYGFYDKVVIIYTDKNGDEQELISNYNEPANIPDQSKDGYTLTGWEDEQGNPVDPTQPITEDVKIRPIYRTHTYTIKFNGNGANGEMTNLAMTYDETKTLPTNAFDFPGRTYTGWDTEANGSGIHYDDQAEAKNLTAEDNGIVTLYAQWSINPFHIDYDGNGATSGEMATTNCEYDGECVLRENAFKKTGYHFVGWKYNNNDYADKADVKNIIESGTITMVAQWEVNHYTIVFDINTDDSNATGNMADMTNLEYDHDYTLTANAFTRTGYNFGGWNTEIDGRNFGLTDEQEFHNLTTTDNAVITLYAQWDPTRYTIIFHANNENVENPDAMAAQVVTYDVETTLNPIEYTWWQHKLVEWTTNANGTGTKYADKATIKNLNANGGEVHLYAKWREIDAALQAGGVGRSPTGTRINALLAANPDAKRFVKYTDGIPSDEVLANAVDTSGTIDPIWLWVEGENLYWWSEDVKPRISSKLTSTDCLFNGAGTYTVDGVTKHLEYADLTGFDTSNITDYGRTFHSSGILEINISDWDFSHATNMSEFIAFGAVKKATFPEVVDARNVTNMYLALNFGMVTDELDLSGWKTRDVKNLSNFLSGMQAKKIKFSSDFKTNNVENMASMFSGNSRLTSIEGLEYFDTAKVKNMSNMFAGVSSMESLDLSTFSTTALTNMKGMFSGMSSLTSLTLGGSFTANDVTDFTNTFKGLTKLQTIDLSNLTSTPTDMSNMFESSSGAKVIDISGMDLSAVTKFTYTFIACGNLETIYVSNNPNQENITDDGHIFLYSGPKIVGGAGSNHLGSAAGTGNGGGAGQSVYARIDDPDNGNPGYFTIKGARYIRYHDNDGDDTNDEVNYALMKSHYLKAGGKLTKNAFVRDGYVFTGWKDVDNNGYTDEQVMADLVESKTPLELYAQWIKATSVLKAGSDVNIILKSINPNVVSFVRYNGIPDFDAIGDERVISPSNAVVPTYAWSDGDTIYWWSEAETVYLNENSGSFFKNLSKLTTIEQTTLDTSKVKNMDYMFQYSGLVDFTFEMDTSNVTSMDAIFANCSKLERLDLSHVDTSKVINMHGLVADAQKLTYLNLDNFSTASATNLESMFSTVKIMTTLDLTSFDTRKVTNMGWMISYITDLQTIYATDLFVPANNITMPNTLVGGAGSRNLGTSSVYARIDDPDNGNPGYFTIKGARYIRYHDNDGDNTNNETNYALMTSHYLKAGDSLKKNAFVRDGYVFTGWKDADGNDYADEQVMAGLTESKTPLELYAQWDAAPYTVTFNANGGEVLQSAKTVTYLQPYGELPTPVRYDYVTNPNGSILGSKYGFKEWNTKADGSGNTITSSSIYANAGDTTLYAIWNDRFTVTIYNGESETPTIASYGVDDEIVLNAQNVTGKQFLYWEVDGAKKSYSEHYSMHMFQGKDLTIRAIYGSESDLGSQQPGTYISDIYRQYSNNKILVRSYSYVPDGYKIVKAGVIATLDANIANGTFDDQTATYPRAESVNGSSDNYYFTWSKKDITSEKTVYVKAYLKYEDTNGAEHTIYGDLVTATLTE